MDILTYAPSRTCSKCGGAILTGVNGYGGKVCTCDYMKSVMEHYDAVREKIVEKANQRKFLTTVEVDTLLNRPVGI